MSPYLTLGLEHITDLNGFDHILFLLALCAPFTLHDWRRLLVLVTAFTVGHSLTLALAVLGVVAAPTEWIEFLIPVTIVITAARNLIGSGTGHPVSGTSGGPLIGSYVMALGFGLIHGMGFSNYLRSLLGSEIVWPLFLFNVGLEVGQLVIVSIGIGIQWLLLRLWADGRRWWTIGLSVAAALVALRMAVERWPM
jgi:hypothetical protein